MKPIELNLIERVNKVNYQRQVSVNDRRVSTEKTVLKMSGDNYSRLINESQVDEDTKLNDREKQEMRARREEWIARVQANKMFNVKQCVYGNEQAKRLPGKQIFVTEVLIDKNLTLIIPEQMRTRDLNQNYSLKFKAQCYSGTHSCLFGRTTESQSIPLSQDKSKII